MNRNTTPFLCVALGTLLTSTAIALPIQAPSSPQQAAPSSTPGANASVTSDVPELPGTSANATANSLPEGLKPEEKGVWDQDLLTGDWGGFRKTLEDDGVKLSPTYIGEVFGNVSGGALGKRGVIYEGLLNVQLDLDLDKALHEDTGGLQIHANALEIHGPSLSAYDVGDFSNTSNIAAYNTLRLDELWIQKWFWEKRVSLKVGNMAVDNEFFQSSSAALFINGTFGAFTFIASNLPNAPVYPLASPGVRVQFLPTSDFYVMAGVYGQDVNSNPTTNNQNGTRFALTSSSGMLVMSEAGYLVNQSPNDRGLQGTYRLGSFVHTEDSATFDGSNGGTSYGVYGVMDQQLYTHNAEAISLFVRSGGAPSNTNFVDYYVDGGFNFTGFIPGRDNDIAGLGIARSHVSQDFSNASLAAGGPPSSAETVLEATYKYQVTPWWCLQPDVQYIITPSGVQGSSNAVVLGLRTCLSF